MKRRFVATLVAAAFFLLFALGCGRMEDTLTEADQSLRGTPEAASLRVSYIDVGKGDCMLIQEGDTAVLIDTGYENTSDTVVSYLREVGVEQLSCAVLTHYDKDHVGGLLGIGRAIPLNAVYLPGYEGADKPYRMAMDAVDSLGVPAQRVTEELHLAVGAAELVILPSSLTYVANANGDEGNDNDLSLVATLTLGRDSYLFAGDLEKEGIEAYLEAGRGTFDVLKMPHHGQKSGNTDELLESVQPQVVIITDGSDDPADKKTLKLLQKAGITTYCTSSDGTIVVRSDGAGSYEVSASH